MMKWSLPLAAVCLMPFMANATEQKELKAGIIGLDTSHVMAFTKAINFETKPEYVGKFDGVTVTVAYPQGSKDIESSVSKVADYTQQMRDMKIEILDSIEDLVSKVDVVLLESNDGRVHLEQVRPVIAAKKPVYIDKPIAGSLEDALEIFALAEKNGVPVFSTSSLRYGKNTQAFVATKKVAKEAMTHSPSPLEATHPDLYWYGVHGVESLFTVMGTGCISVKRGVTEDGKIEVIGKWKDGRTGIFRESNATDRKGYGGYAKTDDGEFAVGEFSGYEPMLVEVVKFFKEQKSPVAAEETLEVFAFMTAADESKRLNGAEVTLASVMEAAKKNLAARKAQ